MLELTITSFLAFLAAFGLIKVSTSIIRGFFKKTEILIVFYFFPSIFLTDFLLICLFPIVLLCIQFFLGSNIFLFE